MGYRWWSRVSKEFAFGHNIDHFCRFACVVIATSYILVWITAPTYRGSYFVLGMQMKLSGGKFWLCAKVICHPAPAPQSCNMAIVSVPISYQLICFGQGFEGWKLLALVPAWWNWEISLVGENCSYANP